MLAAVIQVRMGSQRLPGKTLADVEGKPMLERLMERIKASRFVEEVILATTQESRDDLLIDFARKRGIKWFRGSEQDVLDRVYQAARQYGVRDILRVTPDCPLLDPFLMDQVIEIYRLGSYDYVSNTLGPRYPDGLDVEIFSFGALEMAWKQAQLPSEREHVTLYITKNPDRFRIFNVKAPADYSGCKWSVDTSEDLEFVRRVYRHFNGNGHLFTWQEILRALREAPELSKANPESVVNAGYYRSLIQDPPVPARIQSVDRSRTLLKKAQALIPGGSQTLSKGPTQFVQGVAPAFLVKGKGCHVWDLDGNEYLDSTMALGPVILGYGDPQVDEAVERQLKEGVSFSLPHPLEYELAQLLQEIIPCAQMVRFGKNGSDATSGAIRLARAYTGREFVACCGYHGWQDWYIGTTTRHQGVPQAVRNLTIPFEYNNLESLQRIFAQHPGQVAACILEPMGVVEPRDDFLKKVQALAHQEGALLIFDEMLTGFRFALGGAQEYFGVVPDLSCFGKAIANGFPLSAVVGRGECMRFFEETFFSFTFGGEALSLAAAKATLQKMRRENVVAHLWSQGKKLKDGFDVLARHYRLESLVSCVGLAPRTVIQFKGKNEQESLLFKSLFQQECIRRGVLFTGAQNPSYSHGDQEVDQILRVYRSALEVLAQGITQGNLFDRLQGEPVQPVFRQA